MLGRQRERMVLVGAVLGRVVGLGFVDGDLQLSQQCRRMFGRHGWSGLVNRRRVDCIGRGVGDWRFSSNFGLGLTGDGDAGQCWSSHEAKMQIAHDQTQLQCGQALRQLAGPRRLNAGRRLGQINDRGGEYADKRVYWQRLWRTPG